MLSFPGGLCLGIVILIAKAHEVISCHNACSPSWIFVTIFLNVEKTVLRAAGVLFSLMVSRCAGGWREKLVRAVSQKL